MDTPRPTRAQVRDGDARGGRARIRTWATELVKEAKQKETQFVSHGEMETSYLRHCDSLNSILFFIVND